MAYKFCVKFSLGTLLSSEQLVGRRRNQAIYEFGGQWRGALGKTYTCVLSCVQLFVTPRTAACQASLSMEFSRQQYWSGLPFPHPGYLPDPEIEPAFPVSSTSPKGPVYPKHRMLPVFIHPKFPSGALSVGNCSG